MTLLVGQGERMEQHPVSIFEVDELCCVNLPERMAEAGLLCQVGGIIAERQ